MNVQLRATDISKSFGGVHALRHVNVDIAEGEVHCLAGENGSGKSTIVKILSGVLQPDGGTITVNGQDYPNLTARQAIGFGIAVIHQDLSLFGTMSVRDNICLPEHVHHRRSLINPRYADQLAHRALDRIGAKLDLDERVENLSMAGKQQVAIARALALDAKVIFMDEPTTALTSTEVDSLLATIEGLKASGVSVIFISHKLDEVFSVADRITVFRSGEVIGTYRASELDSRKLSTLMTGRDVEFGTPEDHVDRNAAPVLEMTHVKASRVTDVSLAVQPGEVVGMSGLLGSGRTETALTLFGLNQVTGGTIAIEGEPVRIGNPRDAIANGIALVPEDRHNEGLFLDRNLMQNSAASVLGTISNRFGVVDAKAERRIGEETLVDLQVNTRDLSLLAQSLSGGNQQKVLLGKWVATKPKLLILDSPTVGVDVGSKSQIYDIIRNLSAQGIAILVISDEEEELLAVCNRIAIFVQGAVTTELSGSQLKPGFSAIYRNIDRKGGAR
ncbi:sugar ABC transporter ATP-binding protein [Bifidobacterium saguinibicoloris]|uniref:sugar ABC transporter ATP-binding protein n=1 Tax=Bifidobacterium saguinibicoloris TaxID=2834433 RepID=UPI001C559E93|nr:sugar ABC transporter ATP-binding protein [Bifidobacterium saguinibicoloris]MBW3081349.1 sugar ABC transporter ATP-binding protein [Bifidobacterium saguinibicoloris]